MTIEEAIEALDVLRIFDAPRLSEAVQMALSALRAQQEAEKNEPLTRDELLTMNGKPVWCEDGNGNACWCLICVIHDKGCVFMDAVDNETGLWDGDYYGMTGDGKHGLHLLGWIAYRHPPKEAHNV